MICLSKKSELFCFCPLFLDPTWNIYWYRIEGTQTYNTKQNNTSMCANCWVMSIHSQFTWNYLRLLLLQQKSDSAGILYWCCIVMRLESLWRGVWWVMGALHHPRSVIPISPVNADQRSPSLPPPFLMHFFCVLFIWQQVSFEYAFRRLNTKNWALHTLPPPPIAVSLLFS